MRSHPVSCPFRILEVTTWGDLLKSIELLTGAWAGDRSFELTFPDSWDVRILGSPYPASMTAEEIRQSLLRPIGSPTLQELARGKGSAAILVDDLTRPTPSSAVIPQLIGQMSAAGILPEEISIIIASGSHHHPSREQISKKIGHELPPGVNVVQHNCREHLTSLGRTEAGTPVVVCRAAAEADLVVSVGCLNPHSFAGYSGGSKIVMPGISGIETIRHLHGTLSGCGRRGGSIQTEARSEMSEVARMVGLAFSVNVMLNERREIAALFAGDRDESFRTGVEFMRSSYRVAIPDDIDVLVADSYPFDMTFQVALYRGFWPLASAPAHTTRVALAACSEGAGTHELFAVADPIPRRILKRLSRLRFSRPRGKASPSAYLAQRSAMRNTEYHILSTGLDRETVKKRYPKSEVYRDWTSLLSLLLERHPGPGRRAGIVQCAPLLLPEGVED